MKEPKRPDSIVGMISGPSVNIWFMHSIINLFKTDVSQRFAADLALVFGPYIHSNRNRLAAEFLETGRDWLFMVDNDMVFVPDDVWCLFDEADRRGPGIYSAPYMIENGVLVCGPWNDEIPKVYHPMIGLPAEPTQVGVVGAGFTLIHRDVLDAIGAGNEFTAISPEAGEDVSFCWRAREAGYVPWLIPKSNPGHFKQVALYPHDSVRNMVGEDVNLVVTTPETRR